MWEVFLKITYLRQKKKSSNPTNDIIFIGFKKLIRGPPSKTFKVQLQCKISSVMEFTGW